MMTTAQLAILKAAILADPELVAKPRDGGGDLQIANLLNISAVPNFIVWKNNVDISEIGDNIVGTELAGLTANNLSRLQTIVVLSQNGINPALSDRRAFFDDIFSGAGGANTRAKLLILYKRLGTRGEKIFATGTGSDVSPAVLGWNGPIQPPDVTDARNS